MDILPEPSDAAPIITRIPYLPHYPWEPWGTECFLMIPKKHGFLDHTGKFNPQHDTSNMASMLQAWLFFGVLAEKIGRAFNVQDFVEQDELGQNVVTLAPLEKRKIPKTETPMKAEMEKGLKIIDLRPSLLAHLPHVFEVWHSIIWLYEVLDTISSIKALNKPVYWSEFGNFDIPLDPFQRKLLSRLDRTQWCPFNRRRLLSFQSCTLRYVTSIPRRSFPPFLTHRNCSESACTGNATDVETFQTRHVDEICSCSFISVSTSDVARICRQGSIPLIEIRPSGSHSRKPRDRKVLYNSSRSIDISLRTWKPSSRFTAISHVWSHGLGNQKSNNLPICQLKNLALAADRASDSRNGPQLVWMDILCIPPPSSEYAAERSAAINKMGMIYAAAETVLVLDYELQRIPIKNLDRLQVLAHLLTCSWMERAWTYNEGSLCRSCCFQFADEIFDTEEIHDSFRQRLKPRPLCERLRRSVELDLSYHCLLEFGRQRINYGMESSMKPKNQELDSANFINGWNALGCRSTTQREDLLIILANLRGINLSHLSRFRPEEKLAVLISLQSLIPFTFLISPNQSNYSCLSEPNRWIPRTFDGSYISWDYLLKQRPLGDGLELKQGHFKTSVKFLRLIMLPLNLDLLGEKDIQICANGSKTSLRVKFLRESYPPLNHDPTMKFLVVEEEDDLSMRPDLPLKGCCLQLSDSIHLSRNRLEQSGKLCASLDEFLSEHHKELRFTYDCPIRAGPPEDLLLLSDPEPPPVSTPCRPDEAHQMASPWTIIIQSELQKYRDKTACRGGFSEDIQTVLFIANDSLTCSVVLPTPWLALNLVLLSYFTVKTEVLDLATHQRCSYAAAAFTLGCFIWLCLGFLPRDHGLRLALYKHEHVLVLFCAVHGLIADFFIFFSSFALNKASRPTIAVLAFTTFNTFINTVTLVYHAVLRQMFVRYLLTVWLATFQDDWSSKTHNKRWWTVFKYIRGGVPDDPKFLDALVCDPFFSKWYDRVR